MYVSRRYQTEIVDAISSKYEGGAMSVLLQSGTGSGKTAMAGDVLRRAVANGYRCVFAAHLDTLIEDTYARLHAVGIRAGFVQAGRVDDPTAPVQVCSLQTLQARGERPPADFFILDEAHRAVSSGNRAILEAYPGARILGLSATPQRGDGQPLGRKSGGVFDSMVCGPSNKWLTAQGYLVPVDVIAPLHHSERGLVCDPVEAYEKHTPGSRAIVFASNVLHARAMLDSFLIAGHPAALVLGDTPRATRHLVRAFVRGGQVRVLIGVGVFIEGWDEPSIETVILARSYGVTGAYLQSIGRGGRPSLETGKRRCTVLDLRGSWALHGLPDDDRIWSLEGEAVRRADVSTVLRRCAECLAVFASAKRCPRCGAAAVAATKMPRVLKRGEKLELLSKMPSYARDRRVMDGLVWTACSRLRLPTAKAEAWAMGRFIKKFGRVPETRTS